MTHTLFHKILLLVFLDVPVANRFLLGQRGSCRNSQTGVQTCNRVLRPMVGTLDTLYPALLFVTPSLSKSRPLPDQSDSLTPSVTSASAAAGRLSKLLDLVRVSSNNNNHRQVSQNSENFSLPDAYIHLSSLH